MQRDFYGGMRFEHVEKRRVRIAPGVLEGPRQLAGGLMIVEDESELHEKLTESPGHASVHAAPDGKMIKWPRKLPKRTMSTERLKAFSDGVIAIIITIMVLELKPPHDDHLAALVPLAPIFVSYVLSFVYVGIYWNNHHHLLSIAENVNGTILWANLHLLFWLSLVPFVTAWMGENHFSTVPVALYGCALLMSAVAYYFLTSALMRQHGKESPLADAIGNDFKGRISVVVYIAAILLSFVNAWLGFGLYIGVAIMWLIPDRRIEKRAAS